MKIVKKDLNGKMLNRRDIEQLVISNRTCGIILSETLNTLKQKYETENR